VFQNITGSVQVISSLNTGFSPSEQNAHHSYSWILTQIQDSSQVMKATLVHTHCCWSAAV